LIAEFEVFRTDHDAGYTIVAVRAPFVKRELAPLNTSMVFARHTPRLAIRAPGKARGKRPAIYRGLPGVRVAEDKARGTTTIHCLVFVAATPTTTGRLGSPRETTGLDHTE